ncbi:MAG: hypothetical protein EA362_09410 [Saprospirales bacterium]|nr:MAG: hypothetical protein EA362_09410 [Saprospirales bacterium]
MNSETTTSIFKDKIRQSPLKDFSVESPLWIYAADRAFSDTESPQIKMAIKQFTNSWLSHGQKVNPYGDLLFNRFIVLSADSNFTIPSGCSIDSSVHFVKEIEKQFEVDLFNRMNVYRITDDNEIALTSFHVLAAEIEKGQFSKDSLIFDMTVRTCGDFVDSWIKPAGESWLNRSLF